MFSGVSRYISCVCHAFFKCITAIPYSVLSLMKMMLHYNAVFSLLTSIISRMYKGY